MSFYVTVHTVVFRGVFSCALSTKLPSYTAQNCVFCSFRALRNVLLFAARRIFPTDRLYLILPFKILLSPFHYDSIAGELCLGKNGLTVFHGLTVNSHAALLYVSSRLGT